MKLSLEEFADQLLRYFPQLCREISRYESVYITNQVVTLEQIRVLEYLSQESNCQMKNLAEGMGINYSSATGMIDRLIQQKLVIRISSASDRRVVCIVLTVKGKKILKDVLMKKKKGIKELYKHLNGAERIAYLKLIEKLVQNLSSASNQTKHKGKKE